MQDVLGMWADAAEDAEHALHEERRLHKPALEEMRQVVEMRDVLVGILEDQIPAAFQISPLPLRA